MTVLVTGGAGFIGSNFIPYWLCHHPEDRVVCLDALTYAANTETMEALREHENFRFVRGDICDTAAVASVFEAEHPDLVVNFAAESHVDRSIADPALFLKTNLFGTQVLLEACRTFGNVHFHQVSTDEVYGDVALDAQGAAFTEKSPLRPSSPYAASKASADLLALSYHRTYALPVTISRCSNNYGPRQFPEKLIPFMVQQAVNDAPMPVYGNGLNRRDWLYVEDHCRALDRILCGGRVGQIYNICAENEVRNIDLVKRICRILGKPESLIVYTEDRKGHDLRYAMDCSKIRRELQWRAETPFDAALEATVRQCAEKESLYRFR